MIETLSAEIRYEEGNIYNEKKKQDRRKQKEKG